MTLIENAYEAMNGSGKLRLSAKSSGDKIEIAIADSGPGIPADQLASLFEIGFASGKGRVSMRLGLPLAQRVVQRHGGELSVQSIVGKGTVFKIVLPIG